MFWLTLAGIPSSAAVGRVKSVFCMRSKHVNKYCTRIIIKDVKKQKSNIGLGPYLEGLCCMCTDSLNVSEF